MNHLSDGVLRRMVDEPLAISDSERDHYRACRQCHERGAAMVALARVTAQSLAMPPARLDVAAALTQVRHNIAAQGGVSSGWKPVRPRPFRRMRLPAAGLATSLALVGALALTPAGSLAQSFITIFQPTQVAPIQVTTSDLRQLRGLAQYGTFHAPARNAQARTVASAAAASAASGMTVLVPTTLPSGVANLPTYRVLPGMSASFTFNAAKARKAAQRAGKATAPMPVRINGSTLQVTVGNAVVATYGDTGSFPDLVIGQMVAPRVTSTGVTVKELENYVLNQPNVPTGLAQQIRNLGDPTRTLPLPVPVDLAHSENVTVQDVPGIAVGDQTGAGSVVIWEKDGIIHGVGGLLKESDVLSVANSLHS